MRSFSSMKDVSKGKDRSTLAVPQFAATEGMDSEELDFGNNSMSLKGSLISNLSPRGSSASKRSTLLEDKLKSYSELLDSKKIRDQKAFEKKKKALPVVKPPSKKEQKKMDMQELENRKKERAEAMQKLMSQPAIEPPALLKKSTLKKADVEEAKQ